MPQACSGSDASHRAPLRRTARGAHLALVVAAAALWSGRAAAQASSWLYAGGGAGRIERTDEESLSLLHVDTGLGTSAKHPVVAGGLFRLQGYFGGGVDLAALARVVSRGFAKGDFGVGVDAGVYQRWWGPNSTGFTGNLVLGAPWGLTLIGGATYGSGEQRAYFASLGIDFARLTVHRHSGLNWFSNPMRAPGD